VPEKGSQGQLCCGENETEIVQLCCGPRLKGDPRELAQLSCSMKLGSKSKSLGLLEAEGITVSPSVRPFRVAPEGSVFVRVTVWVVAGDPSR
jgi:hypothetical protein